MSANGIYGLSGSGLDIESMVKVGMMSRQNRLDKMQQTYTKNEWKKDDLLEVYNKLQEYNVSTLSTYTKSYNTNARTATSSNPLITVEANSDAPAMNHTIIVNKTATNAYFVGTKKLTRVANTSADDLNKFKSITLDTDGDGTTDTSMESTTISFTIDDGTGNGYTPAKFATATYSSTSAFLSTDTATFKNFLQSAYDALTTDSAIKNTFTALSFDVTDGTLDNDGDPNTGIANITYGDLYTLLQKDGATVQDFVNLLNDKIQDDSSVGVTVAYDETKGLTFTNNSSATDATVTVAVNEGNGGTNGAGHIILKSLYDADANHDGLSTDTIIDGSISYSLSLESTDPDTGFLAGGTPAQISGEKTISLEVDSSTSFYDLISKVNGKGTNIRMTYDSYQDKFSIYNMKTGSENSINIIANNAETAALFDAMGLKDTKSSVVTDFTEDQIVTVQGTDAEVLVDGDKYTKIKSNDLPVNGVTYHFGNVTQAGTTAVVTVTQDVEKIVDNVKSFVESYNKLLGELTDMYDEAPNSSYAPLTDAQKAEMTEDQIKKWEEKAKAGMLYHDRTLGKIINDMKSTLMTQIDGPNYEDYKYDSIYTIGISTKGIKGQIQLDEEKLRAALTDDPDSVYKVLSAIDIANTKNNGIAQRLGDVMTDALKSVKNVSGTSKDNSDDSQLSTLLRNLQTKMSSFQSMMNAFEESLYKKYDAMESTLAMLGSQLNYVTGMFS